MGDFLTGLMEMGIKNAILYNFIGAIVTAFFFFCLDLEYGELNLVFFFLTYIIWVLLWTIFYLIKTEYNSME